jgi:hypothetical protein
VTVSQRLLAWLDRMSDGLSPLMVKEARQGVRGREFLLAFTASLFAGMIVAFVGATQALAGNSTAGQWTFAALMACLAFLGLAVVPLGAFSALRHERMEQTLDLITVTSLSPRRIVVGKLLAQSVKLLTLFAAIAPFLTMSFLLGGIDLTTILIAVVLLYMGSVWVGAICLFLSTLFRSRAASGFVFGALGLIVVLLLFVGAGVLQAVSRGIAAPTFLGPWGSSAARLKEFAIFATFWASTLANFVLLAENRLSLASEDTVTPLRVGFFVQFLLMILWAIVLLFTTYRADPPVALAVAAGIHLGIVAIFVLTEGMSVPRRVLHRMRSASGVGRLLVLFGPGAGRGAAYVVAQMILLVVVVAICRSPAADLRRLLAACGYICFFTGVPVLMFWRAAPARVTQLRLRVAVLCAVAAVMVLPDVIHYLIVQPEILDLTYSARHLINPFTTLMQWDLVESNGWTMIPFGLGVAGLLSFFQLGRLGAQMTSPVVPVDPQVLPAGGETGRDGVLY